MRRRFRNPAPVPSGVGSGPAAVTPPSSPVSREEEERDAIIWKVEPITPATDPASNAPKKRGRPKGSKNKVRP